MKLVEKTVRLEHASSPNNHLLLGESFGGCLALSVAARNPTIDLVVILVNSGQFQIYGFICLVEQLSSLIHVSIF